MTSYDNFVSGDEEDLADLLFTERRQRLLYNVGANDIDDLDNVDFRRRYRFNKETFENVVDRVRINIENATNRNGAMSAEQQMLIAMRFYAFGTEQMNLGDILHCSQPTVSRVVAKVSKCLAELSHDLISLPSTQGELREISGEFYDYSGFPCVYGTLDCTHVKLLSPGGEQPEVFRNRKGFFSLNCQTLCDSRLYIRSISARWPGSVHDMTIFDRSYLRAVLETDVPKTYHVLGDGGYALRPYLLTPFRNPDNGAQARYNAAHIRTRNSVERQYGIWKRRFACLSVGLRCDMGTNMSIIVACDVLHNIARAMNDIYIDDAQEEDTPLYQNFNEPTLGGIAKRNTIVAEWFQ